MKIIKHGKRNGKQRYLDKETGKTFTGEVYPKTYVVTSAQNKTPVSEPFLASLRAFPGELIVLPFRYKNPTSVFADLSEDEWYIDVCHETVDLNDNISVIGDVSIQPTAVRPLSGMDSYNRNKSCIFGHPRRELRMVPSSAGKLPKLLTTTGTITVPNYTDSKAGKKAEFHGVIGAAVVTVTSEKEFFVRHITANDDGSFYDLNKKYHPDGTVTTEDISALVLGDYHAGHTCPLAKKASLEMIDELNPEYAVFHDVLDFSSRNHHHKNDFILQARKHKAGNECVKSELQFVCSELDEFGDKTKVVVVRSNHDCALDRWVREADPKKDPINLEMWCKSTLAALEGKSLLKYWYHELSDNHTHKFLERDERFMINGVDISEHGDLGVNGER